MIMLLGKELIIIRKRLQSFVYLLDEYSYSHMMNVEKILHEKRKLIEYDISFSRAL